jgi:Asp-tRNA(Asn)/Glu-tRNA(Gln) amidotransferase A subunit family amidase
MLIACTFDTPSGDPVHADCKRAVIETAKLLEDLGHYVEWAAPRYDAAAYAAAFMAVIVASVATEIEDVARLLDREPGPDNLEKVNLWVLNESRRQTGMDLMRAQNVINQITRQVAGFFETCDILITPALGTLPPPIGHMFADIPDTDIVWSRVHELAPFSGLYNGTGQPAMSLPALWNDQGLPVCVQLVGRYGDENSIIRLASQLETARPWSKRKPVVHA